MKYIVKVSYKIRENSAYFEGDKFHGPYEECISVEAEDEESAKKEANKKVSKELDESDRNQKKLDNDYRTSQVPTNWKVLSVTKL